MAKEELDLVVKATDMASKVLSGIGNKLLDVGKIAAGVVAGGVAAATGSLIGIGTASFDAAMQLDEAFDTIATKTGATGESLEALKGDFNAVFTSVPASVEDTANTISTLTQKLGLAGEPLQALSTQMLQLAQVSGASADQLSAGFGDVMKRWNVSAEDASETLDKLYVASQQSGLGVEGFMSKLSTAGPALQAMGFSLEESTGMIAKWEKSGANTERMLSSLSAAANNMLGDQDKREANFAKLNENLAKNKEKLKQLQDALVIAKAKQEEFTSKTTDSAKAQSALKIEELTRQIEGLTGKIKLQSDTVAAGIQPNQDLSKSFAWVVDAIKNAKEETTAIEIAIDTFGTKAGPEMAKNIREGLLSIDDMEAAFVTAEGAIASTADATADFPEKMEIVKNKATAALAPLGGLIMDAIGQAIDALQPIIDQIPNAVALVQPVFEAFMGVVTSALTTLSEKAGPVISALSDFFDALAGGEQAAFDSSEEFSRFAELLATLGVPDDIAVAISDVMLRVQQAIQGAITWVEENWPAIEATITDVLTQVQAAVGPIIEAIGGLIAGLFTSANTDAEAGSGTLMETITGAWQTIKGIVEPIITAIGTVVSTVFGAVRDFLSEHGEEIKGFLGGAWQAISSIISGIVSIIQQTIVPLFTQIGTFIGQHGEEIKGALSGAWNFIRGVVEGALGLISGIINTVLAALKGDWQGAWDTIKGTVEGVWESIKGAVEGAVNFIWNIVKTVLETTGVDIDAVWQGIKAGAESAWKSISDAVEYAINFVRGTIDQEIWKIKKAWGTAWEWVRTTVEGVWESIKTTLNGWVTSIGKFGSDIIESLTKGISGAGEMVTKAFQGIFNWVIEDLKKHPIYKLFEMITSGKPLELPKIELPFGLGNAITVAPPAIEPVIPRPTIGGTAEDDSGAGEAGSKAKAGASDSKPVHVHFHVDGREVAVATINRMTGMIQEDGLRYGN